jgi:hypothetical protein
LYKAVVWLIDYRRNNVSKTYAKFLPTEIEARYALNLAIQRAHDEPLDSRTDLQDSLVTKNQWFVDDAGNFDQEQGVDAVKEATGQYPDQFCSEAIAAFKTLAETTCAPSVAVLTNKPAMSVEDALRAIINSQKARLRLGEEISMDDDEPRKFLKALKKNLQNLSTIQSLDALLVEVHKLSDTVLADVLADGCTKDKDKDYDHFIQGLVTEAIAAGNDYESPAWKQVDDVHATTATTALAAALVSIEIRVFCRLLEGTIIPVTDPETKRLYLWVLMSKYLNKYYCEGSMALHGKTKRCECYELDQTYMVSTLPH